MFDESKVSKYQENFLSEMFFIEKRIAFLIIIN